MPVCLTIMCLCILHELDKYPQQSHMKTMHIIKSNGGGMIFLL